MINEGGNGMPPFADALTRAEREDLIAYLKSL
jgi:mono/diheme cytochrome c family protein